MRRDKGIMFKQLLLVVHGWLVIVSAMPATEKKPINSPLLSYKNKSVGDLQSRNNSRDEVIQLDSETPLSSLKIESPRLRRSPEKSSLGYPTIIPGNWQSMDPAYLFRLLTSLSTKESSAFHGDNDDSYDRDDGPVIDSLYSGKKPLDSATVFKLPRTSVVEHSDLDIDDPQPISLYRLSKKSKFGQLPGGRRAKYDIKPERDLIQLPSGQILLSRKGLLALQKYHSSITPAADEEVGVIRRPIL